MPDPLDPSRLRAIADRIHAGLGGRATEAGDLREIADRLEAARPSEEEIEAARRWKETLDRMDYNLSPTRYEQHSKDSRLLSDAVLRATEAQP